MRKSAKQQVEEIEMASKRIESECGPISKIKVIENNV